MPPLVIHIRTNGPYRIAADDAHLVEIRDESGAVYVPTPGKAIALCRCGQSRRKPFCDATHKSAGFDGTCARQEPDTLRQADGNSSPG